jgi:hypothetical protein
MKVTAKPPLTDTDGRLTVTVLFVASTVQLVSEADGSERPVSPSLTLIEVAGCEGNGMSVRIGVPIELDVGVAVAAGAGSTEGLGVGVAGWQPATNRTNAKSDARRARRIAMQRKGAGEVESPTDACSCAA